MLHLGIAAKYLARAAKRLVRDHIFGIRPLPRNFVEFKPVRAPVEIEPRLYPQGRYERARSSRQPERPPRSQRGRGR
jgi:hypothetical protein